MVRRDNKRGYVPSREGTVDMVLLEGLGRPHWVGDNVITQVEEPVVRAAVETYLTGGPHEPASALAGTAVR